MTKHRISELFYTLLAKCFAEIIIVVAMRRNLEIEAIVDSLQPFSLQQYVLVSQTSVNIWKKLLTMIWFLISEDYLWKNFFHHGKLKNLYICNVIIRVRSAFGRSYEHVMEGSFEIQI